MLAACSHEQEAEAIRLNNLIAGLGPGSPTTNGGCPPIPPRHMTAAAVSEGGHTTENSTTTRVRVMNEGGTTTQLAHLIHVHDAHASQPHANASAEIKMSGSGTTPTYSPVSFVNADVGVNQASNIPAAGRPSGGV